MAVLVASIFLTFMLRGKYCGRGTDGGAMLMDLFVFLVILGLLGRLFY